MALAALNFVAASEPRSGDPHVMSKSLHAMVEAGAFGVWQQASSLPNPPAADGFQTIERYAQADLAAAFVLSQHPMFVETAYKSTEPRLLADIAPLIRGEEISAVAISHMRRGQSPDVVVKDDEIVLTGSCTRVSGTPWATWLLVGAIDRSGGTDEVLFAFLPLDAANRERISFGPREEAAGLTASDTRTATLDEVTVPLTHVVGRQPHLEWLTQDHKRIVNSKPLHYGYGRHLLALLAKAGGSTKTEALSLGLENNREEALQLQAAASPERLPRERLLLRLKGFAIVRDIAAEYASCHNGNPALPDPELISRTVRTLEFPATNRYIQRQTSAFFANRQLRAEDMPEFSATELLRSI